MASPNSTFTELVSTTFRNHRKELADNVSKNNALFNALTKGGRIDILDGGISIAVPLEYANNATYQRYSGYDVLNIQASDVISAAEYQWKQVAVNVVASGLELRNNSGKSQIIKLAKARIKNANRTAANNMSVDIYSDGALSNQIGGLAHIITADGTGTVGGIVAGTWTMWKNKFREMTGTNLLASPSVANAASLNEVWHLPILISKIPNCRPCLICGQLRHVRFSNTIAGRDFALKKLKQFLCSLKVILFPGLANNCMFGN